MNHLVQIAQRTNKAPIGFKVQLVVHRLNATLASLDRDAELVAVVVGRKKKVSTKPATYQAGDPGEAVWGDILPFSSTLYMAKTGLFQAKRFQIHVLSPSSASDKPVAIFEFDLAELVPVSCDSAKESTRLTAVKCREDPHASISLTVVSSKVTLPRNPREAGSGHAQEQSFAGSDSDISEMSAYTYRSRASSSMVSGYRRPSDASASGHGGGPSTGGKADALRFAGLPAEEPVGSSHEELTRIVQELEAQLRQSEEQNVKLEAANEEKDRELQRLSVSMAEIVSQVNHDTENKHSEVDHDTYVALKEQLDALKLENEHLKAAQQATLPPPPLASSATFSIEDEDDEDEDDATVAGGDAASETSSVNKYEDAHEPQLLPELGSLKHDLAVQRRENESHTATIEALTATNKDLEAQVQRLRAVIVERDSEAVMASTGGSLLSSTEVGAEAADTQTSLEAVRGDNVRLEGQMLELERSVSALALEKGSLLAQLQQAEAAEAHTQHEIVSVQHALAQLESKSQVLAAKLSAADQERESAEQLVVSAEATIVSLQQQVRDISGQLQATQQELDAARQQQLTASAEAIAEATQKHHALERLWEGAQAENQRLQMRVRELEQELAQAETDEDSRVVEMQAQVRELQQEAEVLLEELTRLQAHKANEEEQTQERERVLLEQLQAHQQLAAELEQQLGALSSEHEELQRQTQTQTQETEVLSTEWSDKVIALQQDLDYFQNELIESKMKVAQLTEHNDELAMRNRKLERMLTSTPSPRGSVSSPRG